MDNFKKLTPFRFWCQKVIPLVYDESLSYYELLCKVIDYLNHTMEDVNALGDGYQELYNMIVQLRYDMEHMDFQDEVNKKLDEMAQDGTLDAIIGKYILYNETIKLNRVGRLLDRFGYESRSRFFGGQSCFYENGYYYTCGSFSGNTIQTVNKWNENGEIVTYKNNYTELGHANDICTYNDYLLIANADTDGNIAIVNKTTLEYVDTIHFDELSSIYGISQYLDEILFVSYLKTDPDVKFIARLDFENLTYDKLFDIPAFAHGSPQGICYYKEFIYLLYVQSNEIVILNKNGDIVKILDVPDGDGYFPTGENETLFIKGNDLFLWSVGIAYTNVTVTVDAAFGNIFKTNILTPNFPTVRYSYAAPLHSIRIAVNGNATYEFNPEETFTTAEEVSVIANYHRAARLSFSNISTGAIPLINGIYELYGLSGTRTVNNLICNNCKVQISQIDFNVITIDNTDLKTRVCSPKAELHATRSYIEMQQVNFSTLTKISIDRTSLILKHIVAINSAITVETTAPTSNYLEVFTWYIENLLKLCKAVIGSNTTTYKNLKIDYYMNNASLVTDRLSNANINSNTDVVNNLTGQIYDSIKYDTAGKIYHTSGGTDTEFTYSDYVEMRLVYRISST